MVPPAVFLESVVGDEVVNICSVSAAFKLDRAAPEGSAVGLDRSSRVLESALGLDGQGAAQRVEAEEGIGPGDQCDVGNCRLLDEVPVHRVPERFVDTHAVLKYGEALRGSKQRRGGKSAEIHVRLIRVYVAISKADTAQILRQELSNVERVLPRKVAARRVLHVRWHLIDRGAEPGKRGSANNFYGRRFQFGRRIFRGDS